ncbi:hypothetical protein C7H19_08490 [Aphanothece hegewaldii CCALA 016]|uniref:Knr4/Smi1-like domain-containing protein n=1 Tax=Aphanothece hegewaldii CCALA 016 TaxID=2107694 RepID=A0A2T1LYW2_9CHRO|nr:SMI1/KNR4 family protein [Aphanothece hegewaldii]PSF37587.1 hypothetical protein C7H19_08490 [Aphanothece hegewaldii CCALA 016]
MSVIVDAVKRIAVIAKRHNFINLLENLLSEHYPYPSYKSVWSGQLMQEQSKLVDEYLSGYQPRLTSEQIKKIVESYRFKLPKEIYDLYQIGNGCLPIGTSEKEDWNSIYNYFNFPSSENKLWTLKKAMDAYCSFMIDFNPRLLPICAYGDDSVLLVMGSSEPQETSPLVRTYDHCLDDDLSKMEVVWPSLTNMMLAYAEWYEALYSGGLTEITEEAIYQKYSSGSHWGFKKFLC